MELNFEVDKGLLAALEHYSAIRYNFDEPTEFVYADPATNRKRGYSIEQTCAAALSLLEDEKLAVLKLKHLQNGLKTFGFDDLYETLMGEKIPGRI